MDGDEAQVKSNLQKLSCCTATITHSSLHSKHRRLQKFLQRRTNSKLYLPSLSTLPFPTLKSSYGVWGSTAFNYILASGMCLMATILVLFVQSKIL